MRSEAVRLPSIRCLSAAHAKYSFTSDLEDVDMGEAISRLNQNQVALQAALQVTSQLNKISLLNYLPNP